jgi:NAD(P)-dependent dehydrogenase (short-subunit alcohol dehydrogenase family)
MGAHNRQVAIVTGGGSGIGQAISQELGQRGWQVVVADLNHGHAQQVADQMTAHGQRAHAHRLDVADAQQVTNLVRETASVLGRLDVMVNCAGIAAVAELDGLELDRWRHLLDVNLWGVITGCHAAYPVMRAQGFGHLVNVASGAGLVPAPLRSAYTTTKYGVVGLSLALRLEAAASGVKVSVACPGAVRTPIFATAEVAGDRAALQRHLAKVKFLEPSQAARRILAGMTRNRPIITLDPQVRWLWRLHRLSPAAFERLVGRPGAQRLLAELQPSSSPRR